MKKVITLFIVFCFFIIPTKAYANSTLVEVKVNGQVEKGKNIEILVDVKDVERFYAASVDFVYDANLLSITSIEPTDFLTKYSNDIMELGIDTDKNGNTASYSFTFLGDKEGISGSGTLVVINAIVLEDGDLSISQDNMKVKLVQKVNDTVENYEYKFLGYNQLSNEDVSNNSSNINSNTNLDSNSDSIDTNNNTNSIVDETNNNDSAANYKENNNNDSSTNYTENDNNDVNDESVDANLIESTILEGNNIDNEIFKDEGSIKNILYYLLGLGAIIILLGVGTYLYKNKLKVISKNDNI